jgi:hypothetical protein
MIIGKMLAVAGIPDDLPIVHPISIYVPEVGTVSGLPPAQPAASFRTVTSRRGRRRSAHGVRLARVTIYGTD